jgi:hypothetical protein
VTGGSIPHRYSECQHEQQPGQDRRCGVQGAGRGILGRWRVLIREAAEKGHAQRHPSHSMIELFRCSFGS